MPPLSSGRKPRTAPACANVPRVSFPNALHRPYPDDAYTGEGGEVSAWLRRDATEPDITYRSGGTCEYLATGDSTGGRFGLYRWSFGEEESGPDPHFHRGITESFYVLEGTVTIYDGTAWVKCHAGDFAHVPAGGIHGFRNEDGAAKMLLHFAPGAPREAYFEGLVENIGGFDADQYAAFMREHDNHWL